MDAAVIVAIGLAVIGGLGTLAYKDLDAYKRLYKLVKTPTTIISNFAAGLFLGAFLVDRTTTDAFSIMVFAAGVGAAALAFSLVFVFFVWLRNDFARYADKD